MQKSNILVLGVDMLVILFSTLFLLNFVSYFVENDILKYAVGILALISWCFSFSINQKLYKIMGTIFFAIALIIFIYLGIPIIKLPIYITENITLLSIFFVLPFLNSIVVVGRYVRSASTIFKIKSTDTSQIYTRSSIVSFLLGGMLNIATLPLVSSVILKNFKKFEDQMFVKMIIAKSMLRGFVLSLSWTPMEIIVILSLEFTQLSYLTVFPWLILLSGILLIINILLSKRYKIPLNDSALEKTNINKKYLLKIIVLFLFLGLFIVASVITNKILKIGTLASISLIIIPFSFLWALLIKRHKSFLAYSIPIWKERVNSMKGYMLLFLSVGFFTTMLRETYILSLIQKKSVVLTQNPFILFLLIQIIFIIFALLGFHTVVTISILGEIVKPIVDNINPLSISLVLIFSGLSPTLFSPFNISASLTGELLKINPFKITIWNLGFALLFSSAGTLLAILIFYFG